MTPRCSKDSCFEGLLHPPENIQFEYLHVVSSKVIAV